MKLLIRLAFFILSLSISAQNINKILPNFDKTGMETSILYNGAAVGNVLNYTNENHSVYTFLQTYKAISFSDFQQRLSPFGDFGKNVKQKQLDEVVTLGLLNCEFETFKPFVKDTDIIKLNQSQGFIERTSNTVPIFNKHELSIISPLKSVHRGLQVSFILDSDYVFNLSDKSIINIQADFNDGNGFNALPFNTPIPVFYSVTGAKTLVFKINFSDGTTKNVSSKITIDFSNQDLQSRYGRRITTFTSENTADPNLAPYGENNYKGVGEYEIYLSDDSILDKPIFLVDGFDPGDGRNIQSIYELLNFDNGSGTQNLGDVLRDEGFDIVILNFPVYLRAEDSEIIDGGADFIERNAMLLVELLSIINDQKIGNEQNVIIGPSMGGLISRYALNFMEQQSLAHDTRLWISFDAPHLGANVPIGFQHMFNYLAYGLDTWIGDFSVEALKPVVDGMLKSPAARQMLTDQFETHLQNGSIAEFDNNNTTPEPHPFYNIFFSNINSLTSTGYPETIRNVSMINGSGIGSPYYDKNNIAMIPGRKVLDAYIPNVALLTDAYLDAWYTPSSSTQNKISEIWIDAPFLCFCDIESEAYSTSFSYSNGIDTASGGLFDISELAEDFAGTDPLIDAFLDAMQTNYFNFIPSVSAMALENDSEIDWYHNIDLGEPETRTVLNESPFVNWHMPDDNENHITLTQANVDFAISEIIEQTLSTHDNIKENIILKNNPISNQLILLSQKDYENSTLSIIDMTGKIVFENNIDISNLTNININLESGLYALTIQTQENYSLKTKFIVN